ncbi:MAG: segregation/condensation protein A [Planctomycetota bacterium]
MNFRIELPSYRGPIDLLLYLVRKNEVTIEEMPLAKIVGQYLEYLELLQDLDLGEVGDFLDLASTLVEMKSRSVLPQPEADPDESTESIESEDDTPIVQRLLEYKEIRDAAAILDEMSVRWQSRYRRLADDLPPRRMDLGDQPIADLEIWDLVSAFGRIARESAGPPQTEVVYDDTPIHVYMQRIHHRLSESPKVPLMDLIDGGIHKSALIGWFLATLELTRHHGAAVEESDRGDIFVVRTANYSESLDVNEVDNYGNEETRAAGLPGGR